MNTDNEQTFINLKVLGKITSEDTLYTRSRHFQLVSTSWVPNFIRRWWMGESRRNMVKDICITISDTGEMISEKQGDRSFTENILDACVDAKYGILELKKQYNHDAYIVSRLEIIFMNLESIITRHSGGKSVHTKCDNNQDGKQNKKGKNAKS